MTPRSFFFRREAGILAVALWGVMFVFITILVYVWVASERAHPVFLDLSTGKPVAKRPAL